MEERSDRTVAKEILKKNIPRTVWHERGFWHFSEWKEKDEGAVCECLLHYF